jgi:hypothetical protein
MASGFFFQGFRYLNRGCLFLSQAGAALGPLRKPLLRGQEGIMKAGCRGVPGLRPVPSGFFYFSRGWFPTRFRGPPQRLWIENPQRNSDVFIKKMWFARRFRGPLLRLWIRKPRREPHLLHLTVWFPTRFRGPLQRIWIKRPRREPHFSSQSVVPDEVLGPAPKALD